MSTATNIVTQQIQDSVSSLYIAFFGRAPDAAGFGHWCQDMAGGASPFAVAANFSLSPEFVSNYDGLTPAQQVNKFYQNTFNRDADTAGLNYWVAAINSGTPFSSVAYQIIWAAYLGGPNVDPQDNLLVNNKIDVAEYFAEVLASNDTAIAATAFVGVTQDPATVTAANARLAAAVGSPDTFTLTTNPDTAMALNFLAPKAYTPGGNDLVNTLQNEDVLTGNVAAGSTTLTADIGNPNDSGGNVIAPSITNVDTINVAFTSTNEAMSLDFQDITGTDTANITRISADLRQSFRNLKSEVATLGISNTSEQAKVTITYLNNQLAANDSTVTLNLDNASLSDEVSNAPALRIEATEALGSDLQHQIETYNINTFGSASTIATFATGVSSFDDLVVGERPQTINIDAEASLAVGTMRWLGNRVETNKANTFQVTGLHQVGTNGLGFVNYDQIDTITVSGSANVTLANVGTWETESDDGGEDFDFTLDASTLSGDLTADISNAAMSSDAVFTGGTGSERFYAAGLDTVSSAIIPVSVSVAAQINGGAGSSVDTLTVQSNAGGTIDLATGSTGMDVLNAVQGIETASDATWNIDLTDGGFSQVTFNNQDGNVMNNVLTGLNAATQSLSIRSTGLNGVGDPATTAQGTVNLAFTQAAGLVGGTLNLELGHAGDDRSITDAFSHRNYTSTVGLTDNAVGTNEVASLNLVLNSVGATSATAAQINVVNDDFETSTTLTSQVGATNTVNIGMQIVTNSSDYSTVLANALNSTTYNGSAYLGSQNLTFGSTIATTATTGKSHNITTGVAADRIDLSYMTTSAARTAAGFAQSGWLLGTSINGAGGADELVLSATLADPRVVLTADPTYDGYFQNWSNIETLTINNRNAIGSTYVAMDAYAQTNNANLGTVNFADVNAELALGFRFTNNMVVNVDATGAGTNQQAAKLTTLNSFSTANNTINVDASLAGNSVTYTSTGANLANTVTLNYNNLTNVGLVVDGVAGGNNDLIVTAGSLDIVDFNGNLGNVATAAAGNITITTADTWTAASQSTTYDFTGVFNSVGTSAALLTFTAANETNATGLTIYGSNDGGDATIATAVVSNNITGSSGSDLISSAGLNDNIIGGAGNDTITYTGSSATLSANTVNIVGDVAAGVTQVGNDTITIVGMALGETATINGGAGNDTITVGLETDTYIFSAVNLTAAGTIAATGATVAQTVINVGVDTITGFNFDIDDIELSKAVFGANLGSAAGENIQVVATADTLLAASVAGEGNFVAVQAASNGNVNLYYLDVAATTTVSVNNLVQAGDAILIGSFTSVTGTVGVGDFSFIA